MWGGLLPGLGNEMGPDHLSVSRMTANHIPIDRR